jgi:glyoxylase-like metal-dependent hydrolase (beta-lactamase superfamily II)
VNYVLLTHIHADHVGWNTRWDGSQWVPTFPNATVICSDLEWRYGMALSERNDERLPALRAEAGFNQPVRVPLPGVFDDSMLPLAPYGHVMRISVNGNEVLDGIRFLRSAGHSIDHAAISVDCDGQEIVFGGDILHHPFELYQPHLVSTFCEFPEAARASRMDVLDYIVRKNALYFSSHFAGSSAGKITRDGSTFGWEFLE